MREDEQEGEGSAAITAVVGVCFAGKARQGNHSSSVSSVLYFRGRKPNDLLGGWWVFLYICASNSASVKYAMQLFEIIGEQGSVDLPFSKLPGAVCWESICVSASCELSSGVIIPRVW